MITLPKDVIFILNKIKQHNFKAYCVGGGIRDLLLGLMPKIMILLLTPDQPILKKSLKIFTI